MRPPNEETTDNDSPVSPLAAGTDPTPTAEEDNSPPPPAHPVMLSMDDYYALQHKKERQRKILTQVAIAVATVALPLGYLALNGSLATMMRSRMPSRRVVSKSTAGKKKDDKYANGSVLFPATPAPKPTPKPTPFVVQDPVVARDLQNYLWTDLPKIRPDESAAQKAYANVSGLNYKNGPETFRAVETQVIPHYNAMLVKATAFKPETKRIRSLHEVMLASVRLRLMGFRHMIEDKNDPFVLWQYGVRAEMAGADDLVQKYQRAVVTEAQRQGVKLPD